MEGLLRLILALLTGPADQWDPDHLVRYSPGTSCIVLSVPHGGRLRPEWIPDRRAQGCDVGGVCLWNATCPGSDCRALLYGDPHTLEIAGAVRDALAEDGLRAHLVANHLDRMKMDPNRGGPNLSEGVQYDLGARKIYDAFHGFLERAAEAVQQRCGGRGLLLDIHGQHHPENWTEIGYLLSKSELNGGQFPAARTSIRGLVARSGGGDARRFVTGRGSLGTLLNGFGYRVVPSASVPAPDTGGYYSGGFITQAHGSRDGGEFDAIQVEITQAVLYAGTEARRRFSKHLATSIGIFARANGYA